MIERRNIDDLRADDNGAWIHGGKPKRKYCLEFDSSTSEVTNARLVSNSEDTR